MKKTLAIIMGSIVVLSSIAAIIYKLTNKE